MIKNLWGILSETNEFRVLKEMKYEMMSSWLAYIWTKDKIFQGGGEFLKSEKVKKTENM